MAGNNIEDIYVLSPLQEGLLFHSLYSETFDTYLQQMRFSIRGNLDVAGLEQAWQLILERHSILRTAFIWDRYDKPLQMVRRRVKLPWQEIDWRSLNPYEQQQQLDAFMDTDRKQRFELSKAPLLRLTLIRLADDCYELFFSLHHLLLDGWSTSIIIKELFDFYDGSDRDLKSLMSAPRPYRDYIEWLQHQDTSEPEQFWRAMLDGFNAPTQLNLGDGISDLPDDDQSFETQTIRLNLSATERLKSLARQNGVTLNTIVLGAWALLMGRYASEKDIVFGITVSGRPPSLEGVESMVGLFINTLPIRVQLPPRARLLEWLAGLQDRLINICEHAHSPLTQVHGYSAVPRGVPLFESMMVFENYPDDGTVQKLRGIESVNIQIYERSNYPLGLIAAAAPQRELFLQVGYNRRFSFDTVQRMLGHLTVMLESMGSDPSQRLQDISLLTPGERYQILIEWNETASGLSTGACVHSLFQEQVERNPQAIAASFDGEVLSYEELNHRANKLANYLRSKDVGPETNVGICVERSIEMIVGLLGILKAGAAYVPIDPAYPASRLSYILQDAQIELLLGQERLMGSLPSHNAKVVLIDADDPEISRQCDQPPLTGVTCDNSAYVVYTSGSTGKPKGVVVTHQGICNTLLWRRKTFSLSAKDRILQNLSFTFDASVWQIFGSLLSGAQLVLARPDYHRDVDYLVNEIIEHKVTIADFPPSMLRAMMSGEGLEQCKSLKHVFCGGEALSNKTVKSFFAQQGAWLHNMYGPTETAVDATYWTCKPTDDQGIVPIGHPIDNKQIYLLDGQLQPVPVGVPGELYIGGSGLARCYLNRPDMTAERFIPHSFSDEPGARLYRTGDVARYLPGGEIEFIGRYDRQVKIRGFRIELGEIEAALSAHPAIKECAVIVREDVPGNPCLVAYIVNDSADTITTVELRSFIKETLPDHMVPPAFVMLESLPVNVNGKLEINLLPAPGQADFDLGKGFVMPRTLVEELLTQIWTQLLGANRVGIHDDFFSLGGHSLLAIRIVSRVRDAFQIELPVRAVFENPTVEKLAGVIESAIRGGGYRHLNSIMRTSREKPMPMSFAQQRLWFLDRLAPNNAFYNLPEAFRIGGPLSVSILEASLNAIIDRHEIFRTTFAERDEQLVQIIAPEMKLSLPIIDLRHLPAAGREVEARRLAAWEARSPFDLSCGPLIRALLLRLDDNDYTLLLTLHHIVADGWSMGVLLGELVTIYTALSNDSVAQLSDLPIQYADFAKWQQEWLQKEVLEKELDYWRKQLDSATALLELPTDRPRPAIQNFNGGTHIFVVPDSPARFIRDLSRHVSATPFMVLLAIFNVLLYRYTGQEDIVVGSSTSGRNRSELERLIGFFINTLVLRTDLSGNPSFRELLAQVREVTLGAYTHQDIPFEKLVEELQPERDLSYSPIFQVMFTVQNLPHVTTELSELSFTPMETKSGTSKFDLEMLITDTGDGLSGCLEYNKDLFDPGTIARMIGHFLTLIEGVMIDTDQQILQLSMLTGAERKQLLEEFNCSHADFLGHSCVHELFEAQAERTPNAPAVAFEGEQISYAELNRTANGIAHSLIRRGVGRGVIVVILGRRNIEFLATIIAVFKAGAAYLPLDPHNPARRIRQVLTQSEARFVVCSRDFSPVLEQAYSAMPEEDRPETFEIQQLLQQNGAEENPPLRCSPDDLAYVIFTSGSTGMPKGAMVEHKGMLNHLYAKIGDLNLTETDAVAQTASQSFDISVWQFLAALVIGGRVNIIPDEIAHDPRLLLQEVDRKKITILETVPSLLRAMFNEWPFGQEGMNLHSLRWMIPTGEALPPELCHRWLGLFPDVPMMNAYGPTECSDDVSHYPIFEAPPLDIIHMPIGRPVANMQLYVLDSNFEPVPIAVPGELFVGGIGVGRGYLNDPNRTAEAFVPDCFSKQPGARLYRTGDKARYLPDGNIEFLGRLDHQVKIRGFRIEIGEVEFALRQHEAIGDAVVVDRTDESGGRQLVAYVVSKPDQSLAVSNLRAYLKDKMPEYMVPSSFLFLEALPLTPSGKLDRKALPAPDPVRRDVEVSYIAPRGDIETRLVRIWEDVLNVRPIGAMDNFFDLGGHSILALRLMSEIQKQFGRDLPLAILFEQGTVEHLAIAMRKQFESTTRSPVIPIQPLGSKRPLFFVHVGSGHILCYLDLARRLGTDQPFYGIQDPMLFGPTNSSGSIKDVPIEEMAACYINSIREIQPEGPYLLGGWSFGGLVAFEMANQLRHRGEQVGLLALLDTGSPDVVRKLADPDDDASLLGILAREMRLPIADSDLRLLGFDDKLFYVVDQMEKAHLMEDPLAYLKRQLEIFKSRIRVIHKYNPKPFPERIIFFKASEMDIGADEKHLRSETALDPTRGIDKLSLEPIELYTIPGTHHQIAREPNVQVLADILKQCLDRSLQMEVAVNPAPRAQAN